MKKVLSTLMIVSLLFGGCSQRSVPSYKKTSQSKNCGSAKQKKAKYDSMKRGTSPGGGMLK